MADPTVERAQAWLRAHEDDLVRDTVRMLQIPSLEGEPEPAAPFGRENRRALDLALGIAKDWGMFTKDLDGYAGYAEIGSGEKLVVGLGHLDVVPVGPGWKHEPFGAEMDAGYIYARGATDDKGPTMAMLYAVRALQETAGDLPARLRMVFGCNEESGMECVKHYREVEEAPTFGVAPDSGWPLYHAEKGIANLTLTCPVPTGEFRLTHLEGGQRPNIVIDSCTAVVEFESGLKAEIEEKVADSWDRNLSFEWQGDTKLQIHGVGKAAHGSYPYGGDSAAIRVWRFVLDLAPLSVRSFYEELFEIGHISGAGLGIHGRDDVSRDLTANVGIVGLSQGSVRVLVNVRYPVTWTGDQLRSKCEAFLTEKENPWKLSEFSDSPSLYFPLDHPLVRTIVEVHRQETGEDRKPGVMGGGTYARMLPNTVSIGTGWAGDGNAHETDERVAIASLHKMARIYAHLLWRLVNL